MEVNVNAPKVDRSWTGEYDFGQNLNDAVAMFGADVVYNNFVDSAVITLQGLVRGKLSKGMTDSDIADVVSKWKPGVTLRTHGTKDPMAAIKAKFAGMTAEEKAAFIDKLTALAAG